MNWFLCAFLILFFILTGVWLGIYGMKRTFLIAALRFAWMMPMLTLFYPQVARHQTSRAIDIEHIYLLVDDSASMQGLSKQRSVTKILNFINNYCQSNSCKVEVDSLSRIAGSSDFTETKLVNATDLWVQSKKDQHWLILSDGGDHQPHLCCDQLRKAESTGAVIGLLDNKEKNVWIHSVRPPITSFDSKSFKLHGVAERNYSKKQTIQIVFEIDEIVVKTLNLAFLEGERSVSFTVDIPGVEKGKHKLTSHILPVVGEKQIWDNHFYSYIETQSNTVGVLHLLGTPSWDGRFLRQYLKSEPKYDLVSFYILRDVWDSHGASERDLSLIPFPSERLFMTELPNFKVLVVQNFMLYQFLRPKYQQKLVEFVRNGGSLLFIGGERALQRGDLDNSRLDSILPFKDRRGKKNNSSKVLSLFGFDQANTKNTFANYQSVEFNILPNTYYSTSNPNLNKMVSLADKLYSEKLSFSGLNILKNFEVKPDVDVLYHAKPYKAGELHPLLLSSKVGKGKALWLLTDGFSQVIQKSPAANHYYQAFLNAAFSWFLQGPGGLNLGEDSTSSPPEKSGIVKDLSNLNSKLTLERLSSALGASLILYSESGDGEEAVGRGLDEITAWLGAVFEKKESVLDEQLQITESKNFFWYWSTPWVYLSFLCLLSEPVVRRWFDEE